MGCNVILIEETEERKSRTTCSSSPLQVFSVEFVQTILYFILQKKASVQASVVCTDIQLLRNSVLGLNPDLCQCPWWSSCMNPLLSMGEKCMMSQISLSIIMLVWIKILLALRRQACHIMNLHLLRITELADCRESSTSAFRMIYQAGNYWLPQFDKWDKWGKLRIQCLPPPHSLPWLLTLTALSVYISVSASLHLG